MRTSRFFPAFLLGILLFIVLNLATAHFMSDCGLPGVLGISGCSDDIARAGFPFPFYEEGGFDYRNEFSTGPLALDIGLGLAFAAALGWWWARREAKIGTK
ncbi:MAG: hypothetical protein AB1649_06110 [Chloroflexota bacterium]